MTLSKALPYKAIQIAMKVHPKHLKAIAMRKRIDRKKAPKTWGRDAPLTTTQGLSSEPAIAPPSTIDKAARLAAAAFSASDQPQARKVITVPQAGEELGISRGAAYEAAKRGEIPTIKIGKLLRVPRAAFDLLLAGK